MIDFSWKTDNIFQKLFEIQKEEKNPRYKRQN